jgi:hypothetical protein
LLERGDFTCPECGKTVDRASPDAVVAIEQELVPGGDLPDVRQVVDGPQHYCCNEDHVPRQRLYRVVRNDGSRDQTP